MYLLCYAMVIKQFLIPAHIFLLSSNKVLFFDVKGYVVTYMYSTSRRSIVLCNGLLALSLEKKAQVKLLVSHPGT